MRAPGLWMALGWIAFYFALQAVAGVVFTLVLAVVTGYLHSWQELSYAGLVLTLDQPGTQALLVILVLALATATIMLLVRRRWPRLWSLAEPPGFGFVRPPQARFLLLALVIGLATPFLGGWLTQWLAQGHPVTQNIQQLGEHAPLGWRIPLALMAVTLGPLVEELLFRGVLLSALLQRWGTGVAVLLSSLAFALAHLPGLNWQLFALPALLGLALALAWLRLRSGSIWPSVVAHGANNALAVAAWFVLAHPGG
ncbi:MAG TPA: CPBP family intramembrane glutamic endopeptidase [Rhodanobacter sp.]|nr:CPBP family intramembrane glutamic endopeptidase [Rhodanobacter sp.]